MKGADPQRADRLPEDLLQARAHLAGGLVGEGHRHDAVGRDALNLHQPGNAVHQHAGLAAAGAGQDQHGYERCGDRLALTFVESIQEVRNIHHVMVTTWACRRVGGGHCRSRMGTGRQL
jgi:hypothetical protein